MMYQQKIVKKGRIWTNLAKNETHFLLLDGKDSSCLLIREAKKLVHVWIRDLNCDVSAVDYEKKGRF